MTEPSDALARSLADGVLAPLSAVAARLDSVMALTKDATVQRRIGETAAELERISAWLRGALRDLQRGADDGVTAGLRELVLDAGQRIGCSPRFAVEGDLASLDAGLLDDLTAVLSEALTNVVRHAYAGTLDVSLTLDAQALTLIVIDDGVGPNDERSGGKGIPDMTARAESREGSFSIEPNDPLGAKLTWSASYDSGA